MSSEIIPAGNGNGNPLPDRPGPRRPIVAAWLSGFKESTRRGYANDLADFARWSGRSIDVFLEEAHGQANEDVLGYRDHLTGLALASSTINRRLAAIRSVVKLARALGRITWSIDIAGIKPEPRRDMKGPNADGLKQIKKALRKCSPRDHALFALLFGLGLRRAEAVGLDLLDVDFGKQTLQVLGKARREKITMEMPPAVARAVGDWVLVRGTHAGPLFHRLDGNRGVARLNLGTVNRIVEAIGKAAGLPEKLRPHGARHAAITELFRRKKTVPEVMSFSRHANPQTVMRYHDELNNSAAEMAREVSKGLE